MAGTIFEPNFEKYEKEMLHDEGLAQTAWAQHFPNSSISPNSTKIYKRGEKILCDSFDNYAHEIGGAH